MAVLGECLSEATHVVLLEGGPCVVRQGPGASWGGLSFKRATEEVPIRRQNQPKEQEEHKDKRA